MGRLGQLLMVVATIDLIYSSGMAPIKPLKKVNDKFNNAAGKQYFFLRAGLSDLPAHNSAIRSLCCSDVVTNT